jgi:U3 small nucleolar RNA-associated protein 6
VQVLAACSEPGDLSALADLFVESRLGAPRGPASGGLGAAAGGLLAAVWEASGPAAGRALFARLDALPPPGGDLYRRMIQLEGRALEEGGGDGGGGADGSSSGGGAAAAAAAKRPGSSGKSDAVARARRVLEAAVSAYGAEDAGLWLAYARFEHAHARRGAGPVYWRAVRALADADAFVREYRASVCADV